MIEWCNEHAMSNFIAMDLEYCGMLYSEVVGICISMTLHCKPLPPSYSSFSLNTHTRGGWCAGYSQYLSPVSHLKINKGLATVAH